MKNEIEQFEKEFTTDPVTIAVTVKAIADAGKSVFDAADKAIDVAIKLKKFLSGGADDNELKKINRSLAFIKQQNREILTKLNALPEEIRRVVADELRKYNLNNIHNDLAIFEINVFADDSYYRKQTGYTKTLHDLQLAIYLEPRLSELQKLIVYAVLFSKATRGNADRFIQASFAQKNNIIVQDIQKLINKNNFIISQMKSVLGNKTYVKSYSNGNYFEDFRWEMQPYKPSHSRKKYCVEWEWIVPDGRYEEIESVDVTSEEFLGRVCVKYGYKNVPIRENINYNNTLINLNNSLLKLRQDYIDNYSVIVLLSRFIKVNQSIFPVKLSLESENEWTALDEIQLEIENKIWE